MPAPTTAEELLDLVRKSGVVDEKRLSAHLDRLGAAAPIPKDPAQLAALLLREGILTRFQVEQLMLGRWRRFTIGKYRVLERLGAGGMGSVYLCEHKLMRRRVAVKILPASRAEEACSLERFYREARAVAALDHPNIVRAYDIDQDGDLHFLVMEHVDGSNLQEIVKKTGAMDPVRACHYIRQAALGLQHAHEAASIVHRDIKPSNILVDRNGIVKVLDMGLARFFHDEDDVLTQKFDEPVLGTADYLAPEQAMDSHGVDIRADLYSLGATFYYCLSGRTPFAEGSVAQKLIWHQTRQPRSLRLLRPELDPAIVAIVEKMMAKDPAQRYQTPREVADALAPWTQTPISVPPDCEMPQLSLAAMGGSPPTDGNGASTRTPPDHLSATRKSWQVPGAPATPPSPTAPLNLQLPPAAPPSVARKAAAPASTPAPPIPGSAPLLLAAPPASGARTTNTPVLAPLLRPSLDRSAASPSAAAAVSVAREEAPAWDRLAEESLTLPLQQDKATPAETAPRSSAARARVVSRKNSRWLVWWIAGAATAAVALVVTSLSLWAVFGSTQTPPPDNPPRLTLIVNHSGKPGTLPTLAEALKKVRDRPGQGARILVQDPIQEEVIIDRLSNISIEGDVDEPVVWKAPKGKISQGHLLAVGKAADFRLKGFILDGEDRVDSLVLLYHHCPGTTLENVTFKGFKQTGCTLANCEGGDDRDRHLVLRNLSFVTVRADQIGLTFTVNSNIPGIQKDRNIVVHNLLMSGPGKSFTTPAGDLLENCRLDGDPLPGGK